VPVRSPLLFVDIDGVLNPYGGSCPDGFVERELLPGAEPVRVCALHGEWLHELSRVYELAWGSAWNDADRASLERLLGLPEFHGTIELPPGEFHPKQKVPAVARLGRRRPLAWMDDLLTPEAWAWAGARPEPTLLIAVDPSVGLTRDHVDRLMDWASTLQPT